MQPKIATFISNLFVNIKHWHVSLIKTHIIVQKQKNMLEIIALILLSKKNGKLAEQKGLKPGLWILYSVLCCTVYCIVHCIVLCNVMYCTM